MQDDQAHDFVNDHRVRAMDAVREHLAKTIIERDERIEELEEKLESARVDYRRAVEVYEQYVALHSVNGERITTLEAELAEARAMIFKLHESVHDYVLHALSGKE